MVDDTLPADGPATPVCPWCSTPVAGATDNCPSCGATLDAGETTDSTLPGLTAIDAAAIVRSKQQTTTQPRSRLLAWISGDDPDAGTTPGQTAALAPPDQDVRREILRLELEAEVAALQAEAGAIRAEATIEGSAPDASPAVAAAAEQLNADLDAIQAELERVDTALETDPLTAVPATDDAPTEDDAPTKGPDEERPPA